MASQNSNQRVAPARGGTSGTDTPELRIVPDGLWTAAPCHRCMRARPIVEQILLEQLLLERAKQQLTETQRTGLKAVAMDMWEPYIGATRDGLPDGDQGIVFDRVHLMREMTKAVDTVRKQEHRGFLRAGEDSLLTVTKYLWLFSANDAPSITRNPSPRCRR
jgi:Transposase